MSLSLGGEFLLSVIQCLFVTKVGLHLEMTSRLNSNPFVNVRTCPNSSPGPLPVDEGEGDVSEPTKVPGCVC